MKILKIWDADYPWDIRVEKICRALAHQGHEVHLLCRNQRRLSSYEQWEYGHIHRLSFFSNPTINFFLSFPAFFNPLWFRAACKLINAYNIDLILVRDLPLTLTAVAAGRLRGLPMIWDMAENYSFLIKDVWRYEPFRVQNLFVRNPYVVKFIEEIALQVVDQVLVVVEESRQRLIVAGVANHKIAVVSNTPDLSAIRNMPKTMDISDRRLFEKRYVVLYVGGLEAARGLDQVIDALAVAISAVPDLLFLIIGQGNSEKKLKERVGELGLAEHVHFRGWVDFHRLLPFLKHSDVGIIPHFVTEHTNHTIPNKLFDYMSQGLPVIASNAKPMVRILRKEQCGFIFKNVSELARYIIKLRDPCLRKTMGERGKQAVQRTYNWMHDAYVLEQAVNRSTKYSALRKD